MEIDGRRLANPLGLKGISCSGHNLATWKAIVIASIPFERTFKKLSKMPRFLSFCFRNYLGIAKNQMALTFECSFYKWWFLRAFSDFFDEKRQHLTHQKAFECLVCCSKCRKVRQARTYWPQHRRKMGRTKANGESARVGKTQHFCKHCLLLAPISRRNQKMTKFATLATTKPGLRFLDFSLRDFPLSPLADSRQDGDSPIFRAYLYPNLILPFTHKSSEFSTILQNGPSVLFLPPAGSRCLAVTSPHDCHRRTRDTSIQTSLHFGGFGCARRKNIDWLVLAVTSPAGEDKLLWVGCPFGRRTAPDKVNGWRNEWARGVLWATQQWTKGPWTTRVLKVGNGWRKWIWDEWDREEKVGVEGARNGWKFGEGNDGFFFSFLSFKRRQCLKCKAKQACEGRTSIFYSTNGIAANQGPIVWMRLL